ncbi:pimeloyl-ACP methyl ester carboxylesterase [Rhodovulum bhavnagarense]|uniref:Pimeloyl-ACP methyl ester carboxylesterase n=1 Tax=Rhodovulum bhavnagarense TaxID=992286 RepID=A0A4R2RDW6_9RHOB|nr:alpha/beta hydrolase [Rhodovulum bhavnagarense]TCP60548.1 pimeloyl-ACP methyl ester carboxylesterase [Rhodovulum bhavnagarense]
MSSAERYPRRTILALAAASGLSACAPAPTEHAPARTPPLGQFLTLRGRRLHYVQQGRGPDVILIHGASGNLRDFTFDLTARLANSYRVTAFDRPGLGYSQPLRETGDSPEDQAAQLERAAAELGIRRAVVVGHSYGAAVAMAWALDHQARVAGLVTLAGVTMPWPEGTLDPWYGFAASGLGSTLVTAFVTERAARRALPRFFTPQPVPRGYADYVGLDLALNPAILRASARQVDRLRPSLVSMSARYRRLHIPVEILHGTADSIVGIDLHARPMAAVLPNARLTELSGIGHMIHHAAPRTTRAAIDRAVARARLRPQG